MAEFKAIAHEDESIDINIPDGWSKAFCPYVPGELATNERSVVIENKDKTKTYQLVVMFKKLK